MAEKLGSRLWRWVTNFEIAGSVREQAALAYSTFSMLGVGVAGWLSEIPVVFLGVASLAAGAFVMMLLYYYSRWQSDSSTESGEGTESVLFGSPVQNAYGHTGSVWSVPISLVSRADHNKFKDCKVTARFDDGTEPALRWGDEKLGEQPEKTVGLRASPPELVSVVERDEPSEPAKAWLKTATGGEFKYSYEPDREVHKLRLIVISDDGTEYESPHQYRFRVPKIVSNGQFTLEIAYDG